MRNINFSSVSSGNTTRDSTSTRHIQDRQNIFLSSRPNSNLNNLQDYRFLTNHSSKYDEKDYLRNLTQMRQTSVSKYSVMDSRRCVDNIGTYSSLDSKQSTNDGVMENSFIRTTKTPYSQLSTIESSVKNDRYIKDIYKLPLLPPNKFPPISEVIKSNANRLKERTIYSELDPDEIKSSNDVQYYKKRSLQQIYKEKFDQNEEEEFYDAISDEENNKEDQFQTSARRPNIIPPLKKTYNQVHATSQADILKTQNKTPIKSTNKYGLPMSIIDEEFISEKISTCVIPNKNSQEIQLELDANLAQYSHPYNFPKAALLPSNMEGINSIPPSVQRIRTPLRYRSNLFGAISNKPNSSCRILSAAEMKKIFCRSKKPIGSLKDFIHKIEVHNENSIENRNPGNLQGVPEYRNKSDDSDVVDNSHINLAVSQSDNKNCLRKSTSLFSEKSPTKDDETNGNINTEINNELNTLGFANENNGDEDVQNSAESLNDLSQDCLIENSTSSKLLNSKSPLFVNENNINNMLSERKNEKTEVEINRESTTKLKTEKESSDIEKKDKVPWWLANIDKPNLVEIDNENVFLSDEENESDTRKPSSGHLFSSLNNAPDEGKKTDSTFYIQDSVSNNNNMSSCDSLFVNSTNTNKALEKENVGLEQSGNNSIPPASPKTNLFSFNSNNESDVVPLFGVSFNSSNQSSMPNETNIEGKNKVEVKNVDNAKTETTFFNQQTSKINEPKLINHTEKNTNIFNFDRTGSSLTSSISVTNNLFSQSKNSNSLIETPSAITSSVQNILESKESLLSNSDQNNLDMSSNKNQVSLFNNPEILGNKNVQDVKFNNIFSNNLNANSNSIVEDNSTNASAKFSTNALFDNKLSNFQQLPNSSGSNVIPSTFGSSTSNIDSQNQNNSLFGMFTNSKVTLSDFNANKTAETSSIFGVHVNNANLNSSSSNITNLETNGDGNSSQLVSSNPTNAMQQNISIFGTNNSPFVFGSSSNKSVNPNFFQSTNQATGQTSNSLLFNPPSGLFGSTNKPDTGLFGGITNSSASPFENRPNVPAQTTSNNGIFGSNPSNILSSSSLIGNNSTNPFVCHTSNAGGTSHRRRIARAKRSH